MTMQPYVMLLTLAIILMLLSTIRIRIVKVQPKKEEKPLTEASDAYILVRGHVPTLRTHYPGMTDIQLLTMSEREFTAIFTGALEVIGEEKNLEQHFDIKVYFELENKDIIISKSTAKTEKGKGILQILANEIEKSKSEIFS